MTIPTKQIQALVLAALMVLSAFAGVAAAAGTSATVDSNDSSTAENSTATQEVQVQNGSAKAMTISWFRDDGDANGPYPVPPNEYDGNESPGLTMFANAKGDAQIRVDNSTARNPNGQWDMLTLNVETSGLEELDPPGNDEPDRTGLVTENFLENDDWNVDISQVGGDKTLDIAANQDGYAAADVEAGSGDIPPVMIFADTEEIMTDYLDDGDPETSLYIWIDPNRATLSENGEETTFEPGEEYQATFEIHGQTETVTFQMVDGQATAGELTPPNSAQSDVTLNTTLAAGTEVEMILEPENGENQTTTTEVSGNQVLGDAENPGTVPEGTITGTFDLSGMEDESFDVHVRAEDDRGSGDFIHYTGSASGTVRDVIDPSYTIENATIRDSKTMTIAYTNPDHDTPGGIANQIGDGHASGDSTIAHNVNVDQEYYDQMWLHYETSTEIFEAIQRSPGSTQVEKFQNSPLSLEVTEVDADGEPMHLDLSQNASGVYIVPDNGESDARIYNSSNGTGLFFSFRLNEMVFYQDGEQVQPEIGDEFEATLTIETEEGVREETTHFEIVEGQTVLATDELELTQSDDTEVVFNSTQARGTAMAIRLTAEGEDFDEQTGELGLRGLGPTICCDGPSTAPWGELSASFNTSGLPVGTEVTAQALVVADLPGEYPDELVVQEVEGEIVEPATGNISYSGETGSGDTVTVSEVGLSDGGFVSVHTGSPTGPTLGASSYLEAGTHSELEISLDESVSDDTTLYVVAHADTNGNQEFDFPSADDPLTTDGSTVAAEGDYAVEASSDGTTAEDTEASTDTDDGETENDSGTPGFGVGVALVAMLAAALIAVHRRD